jgi:hypothetical protein
MRVHLSSEHLEMVTLLDHFDTIFKNKWTKINDSQNLLGFHKPR